MSAEFVCEHSPLKYTDKIYGPQDSGGVFVCSQKQTVNNNRDWIPGAK